MAIQRSEMRLRLDSHANARNDDWNIEYSIEKTAKQNAKNAPELLKNLGIDTDQVQNQDKREQIQNMVGISVYA